jgi:cytochrome c biogenesis protein CcmG, thiol:disulfide interchange protein DsbE
MSIRRLRILLLPLFLVVFSQATPAQTALDLNRYRGKIVVVDFWASWCVPCRRSIPWLNAMQKKYAQQGLVIVGVNVDEQRKDAERFLAETPSDFEILYDPEGTLPARYGVTAMPSSFVFDRQGQLVARHLGFQNAKREEYEETLRKLLKSESRPSATDSHRSDHTP